MPERNEAVLERLFEDVWNGTDPDTVTQFVHDEYRIHDRELADELRGPELYTALAEATREIFPDVEFSIEDSIAAGEKVAVRWTMRGTHRGPLFGVDPTGEEVVLSAIEIDRFVDGELIETWTQSDQIGLLEQVGALPTE